VSADEPTIGDVLVAIANLETRIDKVHADLNRDLRDTRDELRQRITTAEVTFINEVRSLGARLDRFDERITRLETR